MGKDTRANPSLSEVVRSTFVFEAPRLGSRLGVTLFVATETFQRTGSFKFRAAYNVASRVPQDQILAASSGNFGQALACATKMLGKSCIVVMPANSAKVKIAAVEEYGGKVDLIHTGRITRSQRVAELAREYPDAYVASAYDDPLVIEGNASLGSELGRSPHRFDVIVAPLGGGGLASGIISGLKSVGCATPVIAAEPLLANDGARSMREGRIVANDREAQTIADGARTPSLGKHNWEILRTGLGGISEVPEDSIRDGVRLLFTHANLKAEPTGGLGVGALLAEPDRFRGKTVCVVVSGGNVDPATFAAMIS
jgi:threonine dehydratase